jgi:hypothetical protein
MLVPQVLILILNRAVSGIWACKRKHDLSNDFILLRKGELMMRNERWERVWTLALASMIILVLALSMITESFAQSNIPGEGPSAAEEKAVTAEVPTYDFTAAFLSAYIWRGQQQTKNSLVIQPSMTLGYKGFSANIWGNLDTNPYSSTSSSYSSNWTETDLTLSYSKTFGSVTAGIGYIYYALNAPYAGAPDPLDSEEIFATLIGNVLLSPTFTVYKEIDHYHQTYFLLGISHAIEFNKMVSLKLAASGSYLLSDDASTYPKYNSNAQPTNEKYSNFHDGVLSATLPITPLKYWTISPTVSWVFPLCDDAKNEMKGRSKNGQDDNFFYGGITVSFAF